MNCYNTHKLDCGLRIIQLESNSNVVYCGYAIKAGARNERLTGKDERTEEGLAHFCEHMTFKGTEKLSSLKIINSLESVGGELNAYTAKEETVYYAAILNKYFDRAVEVLSDMVFNSVYPQTEIDKEVEVVCDEIESYNDSPAELIYDEFENELFHSQDLGHNVLGTPETVRSFTTEDCKRFTGRLYRPDNAVFYVLGSVDFNKLVKRLERIFASASVTCNATEALTYAKPVRIENGVGGKTKSVDHGTHQQHIMTGTAIQQDIERWRIPLFLVNNMLGGPSMNSRLNIALREKRGLVYSVESVLTTYTDTLVWTVYFGCDHSDSSRCRRLTMSELRRLARTPLSKSRLEAAKRQIKGQIALIAQNKENYAIDMAKQYLHYNKLKDNQRLLDKIDSVTSEEIHCMMNTVLNTDRLFTLVFK